MSAAVKGINIRLRYQHEATQVAVADRILLEHREIFSGAEEEAIRRIFHTDAIHVFW